MRNSIVIMNLSNWFPVNRTWHVIVAIAAAIASTSPAASIPVQSYQKDSDGVTLTMSPGKMKLTVCSDSIVRVMYSPADDAAGGTGLRGDEPFMEDDFVQSCRSERQIDASPRAS